MVRSSLSRRGTYGPELKVLLTSRYTAAALSLEHGLPDNLNVVEKPYRREELAKNSGW